MRRSSLRLAVPKPPPVREEDLQQTIIQGLRLLKYEVLVTSRRRHRYRCHVCGAWGWPQGGDGCDRGIPDLLVWVRDGWRGLEVKGTKTVLSEEQKRLAQEGKVSIVRSWEDALQAVKGGGE